MMTGLVDQLQSDALDPSVSVTTLLRKVKVAAAKLSLADALTWVDHELNGYIKKSDIPDYRKASGTTLAWNPYHGWQPIQFGNHALADKVTQIYLSEPIGNYEALINGPEGSFHIDVPSQMLEALNSSLNFPVPRIANELSRGSILKVVQRARDMVLDWSLELARAGVTGDGLSFSAEERTAAAVAQITIGSFHGSFNTGDASGQGSAITQTSEVNVSTFSNELYEGLLEAIERIGDLKSRAELIEATHSMRSARDRPSLVAAYQRFTTVAADHMTILAPFLPALAGLLS